MLKLQRGLDDGNSQSNETEAALTVQLDGLTKTFGRTTVVNNLSLSIKSGEVYGLIGPNGAGKSTTLKMLMGLLRISGGSATVLGHDVKFDFQSVKPRVGYVPEVHNIYRWMSIARVIKFAKAHYPNWNDTFCSQMLEMMELDPNKKVKHLSKGMLAKLALLLAISHEPDLLVLDEPLSGLDPLVRDEFVDGVLRTICERETTVIFSSHTIDDIQRLADSVGILYEGELLVNQPAESLLASTKRIQVVLNTSETKGGPLPDWIPDSAFHVDQNGREWMLTVSEFSPTLLADLESDRRIQHCEMQDLNLEQLFKDRIRGRRKLAVSSNKRGL